MPMPSDPIIDEYARTQKREREHNIELRKLELVSKRERRTWWGYFFGCVAGLLVLGMIIGGILIGTAHGDDTKLRIEQEKAKIARQCMDDGNIWLNDNCIPRGEAK